MFLSVNDICGLILASLFGFLVGALSRARRRRAMEGGNELRRAQVIADELEMIAAELRKAVHSHQRRVSRFKDRLKEGKCDEFSQETEKFLKPTMELANQIGQAYERIRQQSNLLMSLHESRTDALTGVGNRRTFDESIQSMFSLHTRYGTPFSIVVLDVDHFKRINDTRGHVQGDKILATLGAVLLDSARDTDVVTRYGGEEFVILMPQTDLEAAAMAGERFRVKVADEMEVTVSVGIASAADFTGVSDLVEGADQALYRAKESGRNQAWVYKGGSLAMAKESAPAVEATAAQLADAAS